MALSLILYSVDAESQFINMSQAKAKKRKEKRERAQKFSEGRMRAAAIVDHIQTQLVHGRMYSIPREAISAIVATSMTSRLENGPGPQPGPDSDMQAPPDVELELDAGIADVSAAIVPYHGDRDSEKHAELERIVRNNVFSCSVIAARSGKDSENTRCGRENSNV